MPRRRCADASRRAAVRRVARATRAAAARLTRPTPAAHGLRLRRRSRTAVSAISAIRCDDTRTVRPSPARLRNKWRIHRMPSGSRPLTGSSSTRGRVAEQRDRDPETLTHSEREAADPLAGDLGQANEIEQLVDTACGDPARRGKNTEVIPRRPAAVHCLDLQQRTNLV